MTRICIQYSVCASEELECERPTNGVNTLQVKVASPPTETVKYWLAPTPHLPIAQTTNRRNPPYTSTNPTTERDVDPQTSRNKKLKARAETLISPVFLAASSARPSATSIPPLTAVDLRFKKYKAAGSNIDEQYSFIGQLRGELPIIVRDEVDSELLNDLAKPLDLCIFPVCKMMHLDPLAVKRMLDEGFRKAYGLEVEAEVLHKREMGCVNEGASQFLAEENGGGDISIDEENTLMDEIDGAGDGSPEIAYRNKKAKIVHMEIQEDVKAYCTRRKRARRPYLVVTLRSKTMSETWEMLSSGA